MAIALYDTTVALFAQTLGAMDGLLRLGRTHCEQNNVPLSQLLTSRLIQDMRPLRFQVQAAIGHSLGAIEGVKEGVFRPITPDASVDYDALQSRVADAISRLKAFTPEEINALEGRDVALAFTDRQVPFVAEGFLLTFSLPNFHFHTTTAYGILRSRGVPLGKRDYLGMLKTKG